MIHGRNLIILADGVAIAAAKSCEISVNTEAYEVSSPATAGWRYRKVGRSEWSVSVSTLVTEIRTRFNLGQKVTLTMAVCDANGMTTDRMTGTAYIKKSEITAQLGNLVQGGFTFQGIGVLQPPLYDAEIEYLESTGTQYIDIGVIPTDNHGFRVECYVPRNAGGGSYNDRVIGIHGTSRWLLSIHDNSNATFFGWNEAYSNLGAYYNTNVVADLNYLNNRNGIINNVTKISTLPTLGSIAESAYLFGNRNAAALFIGRIYSCTITYESEIILDFIPVRVGQVGYMYDKVSKQLFGNDGTGSFVLGPDKTT